MRPHFFFISFVTYWMLCFNALFAAPVITKIDPINGPSTGGTLVSIIGSEFTGTTAVHFGDTPAASFVVNSDHLITAISPAHFPQAVFITITGSSGISPHTPEAYFVYQGSWEAYVLNVESSNVSAIQTATNTVVATIGVGSNPTGIAITPDGTRAYVANFLSQNVSVIDTATNTVIATVSVGLGPITIAITPNGLQTYVVNQNNNNVSVIQTATNTVIATIPVGNNPVGIAITPDGAYAYITNLFSDNVSVIQTATNTVITTIPVGDAPSAIAITTDGTRAYVVNQNSQNISVIDIATNTVIATVPVGVNPVGIAITPNGIQAYVANADSNNISVINTATNTVVTTIPIGDDPLGIAITPDGTRAYVINDNSANVPIINTATNTVIGTIGVGLGPQAIILTPDGLQAYVANFSSGNISVIDLTTNTVIATIPVGGAPVGIGITPDQAPLARFSFTAAPAGLPTIFDASESVSPVGTIVNYFWNFGDGTTLNTLLPTTSHSYALPGNYTVTLIVTNSAGTSTRQIFNPSSFFNISSQITAMTHHGGPSALSIETITIVSPSPTPPSPPSPCPTPPSPPKHLKGCQVKRFVRCGCTPKINVTNILTWKAPSKGCNPVAYRIYRNKALTNLVAQISADKKLKFIDSRKKHDQYFIVSVDQFGNISSPKRIIVEERCCH